MKKALLAGCFLLLAHSLSAQWKFVVGLNTNVVSFATLGSTMFAASKGGGVFRSTDQGKNWTPVRNGLPEARVNAVAVIGNTLFAGTANNGVFVSTDNGATWQAARTGLTNSSVTSLAVSGNTLYAGTDYGVYRTSNNGASWTQVIKGITNYNVNCLAVQGNTVYAVTSLNGGVFRSADGGNQWQPTLRDASVYALLLSNGNVYAGTYQKGLLVSSDEGKTWKPLNNAWGEPTTIRALYASGNLLFVGTEKKGIFSSTNNGASWIAINDKDNNEQLRDLNLDIYAITVQNNLLFASSYLMTWARPVNQVGSR
jgi:photosystem II stability/assembly factor-like uncharacterized protein